MVINSEDLISDLKMNSKDIELMKQTGKRLTILNPIRDALCQSIVASRFDDAKTLEEDHYATMHYLNLMKKGQTGNLISFIEKLNGITDSSKNEKCKTEERKKETIAACKKRMDDFMFEYRRRQRQAKGKDDLLFLDGSMKWKEMQKVREQIESTNHTYYSILGVNKDSSTYEITKSFRRLSHLFHPDKCQDIDSTSIFQQLNEAKETLCCPLKRAAYNEKISKNET
jgi:DnaJ domain